MALIRVGISQICTLTMDLKMLPPQAFKPNRGVEGNIFYSVDIELAMNFGSMLEFEMLWEREVVGSVAANYV